MNLDQVKLNLLNWGNRKVGDENEKLSHLNSLLSVLDPSSVLDRGYAIIKDKNKKVITSVHDVPNDNMTISFSDGGINVKKINS